MSRSLVNAGFLLPVLSSRNAVGSKDKSRHILCPGCNRRTQQYVLGDGRRKCKSCGKKFFSSPYMEEVKLKRTADILLCFCLDFPALKTAQICGYRYRFVWDVYEKIRRRIAVASDFAVARIPLQTPGPKEEPEDTGTTIAIHSLPARADSSPETIPAIGVTRFPNGRIRIEAVPMSPVIQALQRRDPKETVRAKELTRFQGVIVDGKLLRFAPHPPDGVDAFAHWAKQKLAKHHGVRGAKLLLYFKELEWKYNNRNLQPDEQALAIAELLPPQFLRIWSTK